MTNLKNNAAASPRTTVRIPFPLKAHPGQAHARNRVFGRQEQLFGRQEQMFG
jgi:hypothetical protein